MDFSQFCVKKEKKRKRKINEEGQLRQSITFMTDLITDKRGGRQLSAGEPGRQKRRF
jgi:hypothetical protein